MTATARGYLAHPRGRSRAGAFLPGVFFPPMSTTTPPNTPSPGSRIRVETIHGEERSVTVDYVEPTPRFNDLDAVRIHAEDGFAYSRDELVRW